MRRDVLCNRYSPREVEEFISARSRREKSSGLPGLSPPILLWSNCGLKNQRHAPHKSRTLFPHAFRTKNQFALAVSRQPRFPRSRILSCLDLARINLPAPAADNGVGSEVKFYLGTILVHPHRRARPHR